MNSRAVDGLQTWLLVTATPARELPAIAVAAEEAGFYGIAMGDHIAMPEFDPHTHPTGMAPFDPMSPFPDVFTSFAAMAAVTQQLHFVSYVCIATLRHPLALAKQVATAAELGEGRVALGVGAGWLAGEFERMAVPFGDRGARLDELLKILALSWKTGMPSFHGKHYAFEQAYQFPLPPTVPIYVGGASPAAQRRARRHNGWLMLRGSAEHAARQLEAFDPPPPPSPQADHDGTPFRLFATVGSGAPTEFHGLTSAGLTDLVVPLWWGSAHGPQERLALIRAHDPEHPVPVL